MNLMESFHYLKLELAEKGWYGYVCCGRAINGEEQNFIWQFVHHGNPSVVLLEANNICWNGVSTVKLDSLVAFVANLVNDRKLFTACASRFLSLDCVGYPLAIVPKEKVQTFIYSGEMKSPVSTSM